MVGEVLRGRVSMLGEGGEGVNLFEEGRDKLISEGGGVASVFNE